jgi:lysophospholipase L1-like esterase
MTSTRFLRFARPLSATMRPPMKMSPLKFVVLLFSGLTCLCAIAAPVSPIDPSSYTAPIRVACVGASITEGAGLKPEQSYPAQLQKILGAKWQVKNFGASGRTMTKKGDNPYWTAPAFQEARQFNPDVVIILMGTNDAKEQNWVHHDEFQADCQAFVETFQHLPAKPHVFLCLLPPVFGAGSYGIVPVHAKSWTPIFKQVARDENMGIIDMYAPFVGKPQMFQDGVHPTAAGAVILAQTAAHALMEKSPRTP